MVYSKPIPVISKSTSKHIVAKAVYEWIILGLLIPVFGLLLIMLIISHALPIVCSLEPVITSLLVFIIKIKLPIVPLVEGIYILKPSHILPLLVDTA